MIVFSHVLLVVLSRLFPNFAPSYKFTKRNRTMKKLLDLKCEELIQRICQVMDKEQLYLRSDLKLQDVAVRLGTNSSYVSECINSVKGQSFSQFVNTYRVRHAQVQLRQLTDVKIAIIATESGFNSEATFFRNFKAVTGMTPREWLNAQLPSPSLQQTIEENINQTK